MNKIKTENPDIGQFLTFTYNPQLQPAPVVTHIVPQQQQPTAQPVKIEEERETFTIETVEEMPQKNPTQMVASKDISQVRELFDQQHPKRKRIQIQPYTNESTTRTVGRPSRFDTLSKLVNESYNKPTILCQELVLVGIDGTEKKEKLY